MCIDFMLLVAVGFAAQDLVGAIATAYGVTAARRMFALAANCLVADQVPSKAASSPILRAGCSERTTLSFRVSSFNFLTQLEESIINKFGTKLA